MIAEDRVVHLDDYLAGLLMGIRGIDYRTITHRGQRKKRSSRAPIKKYRRSTSTIDDEVCH